MGRHYWLLLVAAAALLVLTLPPAFVIIAIVRYLGAPWSAAVWAVAVSTLALSLGTGIDVWLIIRASRPVLTWIRGDRRAETATAAWEAGAHMQRLHVTIAPWPVSASAVVPIAAIYEAAHPSLVAMGAL